MHPSTKQQEYETLLLRVAELERELAAAQQTDSWRNDVRFYGIYAAAAGFLSGGIAATVALIVNICGAALVGRHPLDLMRVYLTFPLGEQALALTEAIRGNSAIDDRIILLLGICLYLGTGMLIGVLFQLLLSAFLPGRPIRDRLIAASGIALTVWLVNFYGILVWLQPLLCGGNWIVNPRFHPIWVAAGTHLVFGWSMAFLSPLGDFRSAAKPVENT